MTKHSTYSFRHLTASDAPLLKSLLRTFGAAFNETETYQDAVPTDRYLEHLLRKDHFIAVVAMTGSAVVGGLAAYVLDKFERQRREIYIYDLAVDEGHRRRGVATGLIRTLQSVAADIGAYVIFVQADLVDAPAIALYDKLGTRETAHHFDIEVPAARTAGRTP